MAYEQARFSMYMNKQQHKDFKAYCDSLGVTMNAMIKVLIDKHMREVKGEGDGNKSKQN